jgi:cobalamin biosynthesis protein CbiG
LRAAGLTSADVGVLATLDRRVFSDAVRAFAGRRGWILRAFPPAALAAQEVPHPNGAHRARVGTPSVAEAAALLAAGDNAELVLTKRVYPCVTVAVGRGVPPETSAA